MQSIRVPIRVIVIQRSGSLFFFFLFPVVGRADDVGDSLYLVRSLL